jgi:hypothetical protein
MKKQEKTGLITFEQLKQACINEYKEYSFDEEDEVEDSELDEATNIDELVSILDNLGWDNEEAYNFIFNSIMKQD